MSKTTANCSEYRTCQAQMAPAVAPQIAFRWSQAVARCDGVVQPAFAFGLVSCGWHLAYRSLVALPMFGTRARVHVQGFRRARPVVHVSVDAQPLSSGAAVITAISSSMPPPLRSAFGFSTRRKSIASGCMADNFCSCCTVRWHRCLQRRCVST